MPSPTPPAGPEDGPGDVDAGQPGRPPAWLAPPPAAPEPAGTRWGPPLLAEPEAGSLRRWRPVLIVALVLLMFGLGAGVAVAVNRLSGTGRASEDDARPSGAPPARQAADITERQLAAAGCTAVQEFPEAAPQHIRPEEQAVNWNSNPPTSGNHLGTWLEPGVYPVEQDERLVVHSLEHGYVAVQYKNLPPEQVRRLLDRPPALGEKLIVQPWSGLPRDGVALSAWRYNQVCDTVDPQIIDAFISRFMTPNGRESKAPEPFAG